MSTCSKCKGENDRPRQRYCRSCHAAYMRGWRPAFKDLPDDERAKSKARAYANTYQRRGKLIKQPCAVCRSEVNVEKHHEDYTKPLEVIWLCRTCHKSIH